MRKQLTICKGIDGIVVNDCKVKKGQFGTGVFATADIKKGTKIIKGLEFFTYSYFPQIVSKFLVIFSQKLTICGNFWSNYLLSIFKNFGKTDNLWTDKLWKTTVLVYLYLWYVNDLMDS